MKTIKLTQGKETVVDDEDWLWASRFNWYYSKSGYALRKSSRAIGHKNIYLHKEIMCVLDSVEVDHINGDKLDNQKQNLRKCTHAENMRNSKMRVNNTSGYKGVVRIGKNGLWRAQINIDGKCVFIMNSYDPKECAEAYDKAAKEYHGKFANLNFPND